MAVMSQKVDVGFEVAPEKKEKFLKETAASTAFARIMERANKNVGGFRDREVERK